MFKKTVWTYYNKNKRDFPWRKTHDPYRILVSEIMLQQTQTSRVTPKYKEFLIKFPNIKSLAKAPLRDVLEVWIGLGYNRRARFLSECAKEICKKYNGKFPKDFKTLLTLPGIGQSTAGALLNFAFNIPTPFIETNIRTVFIHYFFKDTKEKINEKEILKLIEETLSKENSREWFYALYDYGSFLKSTLVRDPAKQSLIYKKQSTFKGSFREKRAFILSNLLKHSMNEKELFKLLINHSLLKIDEPDVLEKILQSLLKDKLIFKKQEGGKNIYII